ncbi:MAG: LamG domain-containing protein [Candidatus Brocadiae bacterium]|nr:LamG domain-containing protein [Candidatus Brocadiia bacterium]
MRHHIIIWFCLYIVANCGIFAETYESSLVGYWKFDEGMGSSTYDTISSMQGTLSGNPTWATGQYGNALVLDGIGDQVRIADSPIFNFGANDFSIALWLYVNGSQSNYANIFSQGTTSGHEHFLQIYSNKLDWAIRGGLSQNLEINYSTSTALTLNAWQHITLVRDGNTFTLYMNAVAKSSKDTTGSIENYTSPFYIGNREAYHSDYSVKGSIDEFSIWHKALSPTEINSLYTSGTTSFQTISTVPELSSSCLMVLGVLGIFLYYNFRNIYNF